MVDPTIAGAVGLKIKFTRQGAVYLRATDCAIEEMADQDLVGAEIVERSRGGFWNADDVVIIGCTWSAAASEAQQTGAKLFPVPCVGSIHSSTVEIMLKGGAGRVVVMGCPEHDGRTREGVTWTRERLFEGRKADLKERVDRNRIDFFEVGLAENVDLLSLCKKQNEEPS